MGFSKTRSRCHYRRGNFVPDVYWYCYRKGKALNDSRHCSSPPVLSFLHLTLVITWHISHWDLVLHKTSENFYDWSQRIWDVFLRDDMKHLQPVRVSFCILLPDNRTEFLKIVFHENRRKIQIFWLLSSRFKWKCSLTKMLLWFNLGNHLQQICTLLIQVADPTREKVTL